MWSPDALYPIMRRQAEGVPIVTLRDSVRWAVNQFTWKSSWLRRTIYIDLRPGVNNYTLNSPVPGENVVNAVAGQWGRRPLVLSRPDILPVVPYVARPNATQNNIQGFLFKPNNIVEVYPWPLVAENQMTKFTAIIRVSPVAASFDDSLYDHWSEVIAAGALSWIHKMPNESWTNRVLSEEEEVTFNRGIATAKGQAATGMQLRNVRATGRNFAV